MVRHYIRKTNRGVGGSWTINQMERAIEDVNSKTLSIRDSAKFHSVPVSTLRLKIYGWKKRSRTTNLTNGGRSSVLSTKVEEKFSTCLQTMNQRGFGVTKALVLDVVCKYVTENNIKTPFKDGRPGHDWFFGFCKRNRLSPQILERSRHCQLNDPFTNYNFHHQFEQLLKEMDFGTAATETERITNHVDDNYYSPVPATFSRQIDINPCLLCWSPHIDTPLNPARLENRSSDLPPIVEEGVHVIFLLRKLLQLPSYKVETLLLRHGHPGGWITLCPECTVLVKQGRQLYAQIQDLQQQFNKLQSQLQHQLQVKQELDGDKQRGASHVNVNPTTATVEIRQHLLSAFPLNNPELIVGIGYHGDLDFEGNEIQNKSCLGGEIIPDSYSSDSKIYKEEQQDLDNQKQEEESEIVEHVSHQQLDLHEDADEGDILTGGRTRSRRKAKAAGTTSTSAAKITLKQKVPRTKKALSSSTTKKPRRHKGRNQSLIAESRKNSRQKQSMSKIKQQTLLDKKTRAATILSKKQEDKMIIGDTSDTEMSDSEGIREHDDDPNYSGVDTEHEESSDPSEESEPEDLNLVVQSWSEIVNLQKAKVALIKRSLLKSKSDQKTARLRKKLSSWGLQRLAINHGIKAFPCPHCEKVLDTTGAWSRHVECCSVEKIGLTCEQCEQVFEAKQTLEIHTRSLHSPESAVTCCGCGLIFRTSDSNFEGHVSSSGETSHCRKNAFLCPYSYCNAAFPSQELSKAHKEFIHSEPYKCMEIGCEKFFTTIFGLNVHKKVHQGLYNFVCEKCGCGFKLKNNLKNHLAKVHLIQEPTGAAKFQCDICGKEMKSNSKLVRHRQIHIRPEDAPHLCSICGKRFRLKDYLYIHSKSHDPERHLKYSTYMPKPKKKPSEAPKMGVAGARIKQPTMEMVLRPALTTFTMTTTTTVSPTGTEVINNAKFDRHHIQISPLCDPSMQHLPQLQNTSLSDINIATFWTDFNSNQQSSL